MIAQLSVKHNDTFAVNPSVTKRNSLPGPMHVLKFSFETVVSTAQYAQKASTKVAEMLGANLLHGHY